jgi:hypothetical protein
MKRPTCKTCPYWDVGYNRATGVGTACACRRSPPTTAGLDEDEMPGDWPFTFGNQWCGEHPAFPLYIADQQARSQKRSAIPRPEESDDDARV